MGEKAIIPETMASAVGCIYSHKPAIEQRDNRRDKPAIEQKDNRRDKPAIEQRGQQERQASHRTEGTTGETSLL